MVIPSTDGAKTRAKMNSSVINVPADAARVVPKLPRGPTALKLGCSKSELPLFEVVLPEIWF